MTKRKPEKEAIDKLREARDFIRELDSFATELSGRSITGFVKQITSAQDDPYAALGVLRSAEYDQVNTVFEKLMSIYDLDGPCPNYEKLAQVKLAFAAICKEKGWSVA